MKSVYMASTNTWKIQVARRVIEQEHMIAVKPVDIPVPELQHDDPLVIARESALAAYQLLGAPVIKCDSGLCIPALGGFPGPYSSYVERTLGVEGLLQTCAGLEDRTAAIYAVVALCDRVLEPVAFYGETQGALAEQKRGKHGYFFDSIFVPEGYDQTMAELEDARRWTFWQSAYEQFAKWYATRCLG